jgi:polyribonucleotide nucleotidyltransferase
MIPQLFVESIDLGDGRNITIETGHLAKNKLMDRSKNW